MSKAISEITLPNRYIQEIRGALGACGLQLEYISRRDWIIGLIDDKNIFDLDAKNLASAMRMYGGERFYAVPARQVTNIALNKAISLGKTFEYIELLQKESPILEGKAIAFEDLLFFDETCEWIVFRTGDVRYTAFVGSSDFVMCALGKL